MKTILYNPIFINPQAYYVFPRLTRYLQPDNESTAEPANYIGTIEVKVIAYGDTTLKRTYTNTDSIDLSEFKNTWIRISLFTKVGSCVLGEWKIGNMESDLPYIDPEVLASLKAVVIVGNKTNNDSDRAIVKNLVDPDNPFVISNAAYTEGSGYADKGSPYYGAFVTDGIDDLITSTKTVQEMLGGSNELTIVSMVHQVKDSANNVSFTNYIRGSANGYFRNIVNNYDKTGIYGYTSSDLMGLSVVNNILGDKNDYTSNGDNRDSIINGNFSVQGYSYNDGNNTGDFSSVAWYWTIIANKVLTTDQINQVIAYFNLDRTLKPDILCNTIKQGITNENHAEFGDKLIDYSGNGRDIQLNNIAWDGDSGIGKYNYPNWKVNVTQGNKYARIVYYDSINGTYSADFKGITDLYKSYGLSIDIRVNRANTVDFHSIKEDGIYTMTPPDDTTSIDIRFGGENVYNASCDITITQIPSHAGALCLDGVNDFGQFVGDLGLKDYTLIMNRAYNNLINNQVPLVSSNIVEDQTPFIVEHWNTGSNAISFSYGASRTTDIPLDINKKIVYQSTYSYMGYVIPKGNAISTGGGITLGKFGNGVQYSAICLWSLMLFPYSMSEFLIERLLKKHKMGTLYPDMVEFRPVINSNIDIKKINYWDKDWNILHIGDYVSIGSGIKTNITVPNGYKISKVTSNAFDNITIEKSSTEFIYDVKFYGIKKSPQKINLTIEQDENYVLFNPIIKSNVEYHRLDFFLNNFEKRINIGDYIPKDVYIRANFYLKNNVDELTVFTFNGVNIDYRRSIVDDTAFNIGSIYNYDSPQEVNITIDEYIRYEDIVQPYPVLLRFKDESGKEVSWGGKFKVGSTITRIGSAADSNLLPNIYNIFGLLLNGNQVTSSKVIVEKTMVFKVKSAYIFDNNEPKCILSPRLLRIPNSSYKILGHIPDISGHGNHGKINNSAYAGASGANGYLQNFSGWTKASGVSSTDSVISSSNNLVAANGWIAYVTSGTVVPTFKVEISGIPINGNLRFEGSGQTLVNGVNTIQGLTTTKISGFYISSGYDNDWSNLRIEQVGEYEGAYCLDGVDDFVTIPTLSSGGKQVLMKVNWSSLGMPIYEQRTPGKKNFAIISNSTAVAYIEGNDGNTYIDGILNNNIKGNELVNITHNITITNELSEKPNTSPMISMNNGRNAFTKMSLYDFMLFDGISTDDKILELNEYVGIEAKIELPPYYWDAYGKTNLDADKATIQQRGVAVGDYDLTNNNFAYDNMSGFGGYTLGKFTNSWSLSNNSNSISIVARNPYDITLKKLGGNSDWKFNTTELKIISNPVSVKFKSDKNIRFTCDYHYYTVGGNSEGAPLRITSKDLIANEDTIITISPISQENIDKYNIDINRGYYLIYFQLSLTLAVNEEVTIEMLPLYPNGLVLDGVDDYLINENIPAFTDFTYILKRELLTNTVDTCSVFKGTKYAAGGWAFIADYYNSNSKTTGYSFGNAVSYTTNEKTIYGTKTSVNGNTIVPGPNVDELGITLGKWSSASYKKMVFYKLMLYPKTIPLLQINFLKNLMERDEIIDLNNKIFIQE